ncbi:MAG: EF-hand domain-containing protein [Deltaproteobacteria bacterium]|nr:EF-hand domain-containing protein [Deltaproteobacteria bacterium]
MSINGINGGNRGGFRPMSFDADGDGSLSSTELSAFTQQMNERTGRSVSASEMLQRLDQDGDGKLSEQELEAGRSKGPPPGPPPDASGYGADGVGFGGRPSPEQLEAMGAQVPWGRRATASSASTLYASAGTGTTRSAMRDEVASRLQAALMQRR